jgi:hypothetical protein
MTIWTVFWCYNLAVRTARVGVEEMIVEERPSEESKRNEQSRDAEFILQNFMLTVA